MVKCVTRIYEATVSSEKGDIFTIIEIKFPIESFLRGYNT